MSIAPSDIVMIPRGVRIHRDQVRDAWVLLAPERAITLDPVGHAILTAIDGMRDFRTLTEHLAESYQAPVEQISDDCAEFITSLIDRRILEIAS